MVLKSNVNIFWAVLFAYLYYQDKHAKEIVLKAMGQAISKSVAIAEIIKVSNLSFG